jgi:hypothetical protein
VHVRSNGETRDELAIDGRQERARFTEEVRAPDRDVAAFGRLHLRTRAARSASFARPASSFARPASSFASSREAFAALSPALQVPAFPGTTGDPRAASLSPTRAAAGTSALPRTCRATRAVRIPAVMWRRLPIRPVLATTEASAQQAGRQQHIDSGEMHGHRLDQRQLNCK